MTIGSIDENSYNMGIRHIFCPPLFLRFHFIEWRGAEQSSPSSSTQQSTIIVCVGGGGHLFDVCTRQRKYLQRKKVGELVEPERQEQKLKNQASLFLSHFWPFLLCLLRRIDLVGVSKNSVKPNKPTESKNSVQFIQKFSFYFKNYQLIQFNRFGFKF